MCKWFCAWLDKAIEKSLQKQENEMMRRDRDRYKNK